ncbi:DUF5330 domain-containing protein [Bartonella ancashensis]|nr:DUF5330 domain-containing protein [Bartonella ancashensis]
MFFIFVVVSLFAERSDNNRLSSKEKDITTGDVLMTFKETVQDLGRFCRRNVQTCEVGKSFLNSIGERARNGAKVTYEYFDHMFGDNKNLTQEKNTDLGKSLSLPKNITKM